MSVLRNEIYTSNDLMQRAAEAMDELDAESIQDLINIANDWMQTREEREAQVAMLEAALRLIESK